MALQNTTTTILLFLAAAAAILITGCAADNPNTMSAATGRLQAMGNGVCLDTRTGRMWQVERSRSIDSLDRAKAYADKLETGGYDDWRLPTVSELYELYMIFDLHQNGDCRLEVEGTYWSDEPDLQGRVGTWELDDNCDAERQYIPKNRGRVRAVRS
jgi:hypothetical protein